MLDASILCFIHSFLCNRWQRVVSSSGYSFSWVKVTSGVPQSSVLGPLLFVLMINSFPTLSSKSIIPTYAHNIDLLHHADVKNPDTLQADAGDILLKWASDLLLSFNLDKCKSITFSHTGELLLLLF